MAFWRKSLEELDGFDPVLEGAEDIELEWRVVDSGRELGYHPAALVWHHRRPGLFSYLRQQRHYGRSQAILERRHPDRFLAGHRVRNAVARLRRGRGGRRPTSYPVSYLSLAREDGALLELAHQWGVPAATVLMVTAPLGFLRRNLAAPAAAASTFAVALVAIDVRLAGYGRRRSERTLALRARVALFRVLRPLAFRWGHLSGRVEFLRCAPDWPPRPGEPGATTAYPGGAARTPRACSAPRGPS